MAGEEKPPGSAVPAPELAFRVGITGTRRLDEAALPQIRGRIEHVLRFVADTLAGLAAEEPLRHVYRNAPGEALCPRLRAVTPLADGADRLFAEIAVGLGYVLDVPLPFAREDYAKDFDAASRADFDRWLGDDGAPGATPYLAIDGGRGDDEARSYEAVGRVVVRNCDLLIAVWDGHPAKGRGGTGDIVRFAAKFGPPVLWIDANGQDPVRLIRLPADLRSPERALRDAAAFDSLGETIRTLIVPPSAATSFEDVSLQAHANRHRRHGIIGRLAHRISGTHHASFDPLRTYLSEVPRPHRAIWQTHRRFFRMISGQRPASTPAAHEPDAPLERSFWTKHYEPADLASIDYRDRYRSSYVLVFALATLTVISANFRGLVHDALLPATLIEMMCLVLITALVFLNQRRDWQGRWISYRLLAELCRKQEVLALMGWSLPASDLRRLGADASPAPWVGWYFDALLRSAPFATGRLSGARLEEIREVVRAKLIFGQVEYHATRKHDSAAAARWLAYWGEAAFLFACALVGVKLLIVAFAMGEGLAEALGVFATVLPAVSAAFVGLRGYSEVELLEQQSARLEATMQAAEQRVRSLRLDRPLASQDLAADVYEISSEMLHDVNGWADLFVLKAVETS